MSRNYVILLAAVTVILIVGIITSNFGLSPDAHGIRPKQEPPRAPTPAQPQVDLLVDHLVGLVADLRQEVVRVRRQVDELRNATQVQHELLLTAIRNTMLLSDITLRNEVSNATRELATADHVATTSNVINHRLLTLADRIQRIETITDAHVKLPPPPPCPQCPRCPDFPGCPPPPTEAPREPLLCVNCSVWDTMPLPARIPRLIHVVWKNESLFDESAKIDAEWRAKEPCFHRRVVTDDECRRLAGRIPGMQPWYDRLPLNVMRADTCRLLSVYFYGGIYMDLDVKWTRPLAEWFNASADIILAWEHDKSIVCNWFFAAQPYHPCMLNLLTNLTRRISRSFTKDDFLKEPALVHESTGPGVLTDIAPTCAPITLNRHDITVGNILHLYGSQLWSASKSYNSWTVERMQLAGWKSAFGHATLEAGQREYLQHPQSQYMNSTPEEPPLVVRAVRQSSYRFPALPMIAGPELALDNYLESYSQTSRAPQDTWWEVTFAHDLFFPTHDAEGAANETVHCIKLLNRRDGDFAHFRTYWAHFLDANGTELWRTKPPLYGGVMPIDAAQLPVPRGGLRFRTLRLTREGGELSVAEVHFFTARDCGVYRRIEVPASAVPPAPQPIAVNVSAYANATEGLVAAQWANATYRLFELMMTRTRRCTDVAQLGEKIDEDAIWPVCGLDTFIPRSNRGVALLMTQPVYFVLEKEFAERGYEVHTFDNRYPTDGEVVVTQFGNYTQHKHALHVPGYRKYPDGWTLAQMMERVNTTKVSFLKLNNEAREWGMMAELAAMGRNHTLDTVLLEAHQCAHFSWELATATHHVAAFSELLEVFDIIGSRVNDRGSLIKLPFSAPCCVKLTLVRKSLFSV